MTTLHEDGDVRPGADELRARFGDPRRLADDRERSTADAIVATVRRVLHGAPDALVAVLGALNARTRFRFSGLYRVEPPLLRNVALFDRENPLLRAGGGCSALDDTYCSVVAADGVPFRTADARADPRLVAHSARSSVLSYVGVPVRGRDGRIAGTLCHFDSRPRLAPAGEIAVLEAVAPLLADALADGLGGAPDRVS